MKRNFEHAKLFQAAFVRFCSNKSNTNVKELATACSSQLKALHERFVNDVEAKRPVPLALMRNILEECNSNEDVELAFQILQKYRIHRSSKARVKHNFNENISSLAVGASLRSKSYGFGLKALWRHNVYGLSPSLQNAHTILSHARQEKDMDLMKKTFETMLKNSIIPTTQTAEIMIRICKDMEDPKCMFRLAEEFITNDISLRSGVFDILIGTAANCGDVEKVFKAQKWREDSGLEHTTASAFAMAKAHILQGEPQIGVDAITKHCKVRTGSESTFIFIEDKAKVNKYLATLVRSWPVQLLSTKEGNYEEVEGRFLNLKENVLSFVRGLSSEFRGISIDAEYEYGKGGQNSE